MRLFLDVADELQLRVLGLETRDLLLLLRDLRREIFGRLDLRSARPRGEAGELASVASTTPLDEMGGIQTRTIKESAEIASIARVGLLENPPLVLGGEPPSLGLCRYFRRGA